jgi:hypothetical protein
MLSVSRLHIASMVGWVMDTEQLVECELAGETEVLVENVSHCHFIHHKSNMSWNRNRTAAVGSRQLITCAMFYLPVQFYRHVSGCALTASTCDRTDVTRALKFKFDKRVEFLRPSWLGVSERKRRHLTAFREYETRVSSLWLTKKTEVTSLPADIPFGVFVIFIFRCGLQGCDPCSLVSISRSFRATWYLHLRSLSQLVN